MLTWGDDSEDATLELRVKTVKYFKSIEKVQDEVEAKYGPVASVRLGLRVLQQHRVEFNWRRREWEMR